MKTDMRTQRDKILFGREGFKREAPLKGSAPFSQSFIFNVTAGFSVVSRPGFC